MSGNDEMYEAGLAKRRKVIGDSYVENVLLQLTEFDEKWQRILTTYCWGEV